MLVDVTCAEAAFAERLEARDETQLLELVEARAVAAAEALWGKSHLADTDFLPALPAQEAVLGYFVVEADEDTQENLLFKVAEAPEELDSFFPCGQASCTCEKCTPPF